MSNLPVYCNAKLLLTISLVFSMIGYGYAITSHISVCANRCATEYCGLSADTQIYHCQRTHSEEKNGQVNFDLSDDDKIKLPQCFELVESSAQDLSQQPTFKTLENKAQFDDCLRRCKVELLNWCIF